MLLNKNDPIDYYRPISVLPISSKIFEKAVVNRLNTYLVNNDNLSTLNMVLNLTIVQPRAYVMP